MSGEKRDGEDRKERTPTRELETGKRDPLDKQTASAPKQRRGQNEQERSGHKLSRRLTQIDLHFIRVTLRLKFFFLLFQILPKHPIPRWNHDRDGAECLGLAGETNQ